AAGSGASRASVSGQGARKPFVLCVPSQNGLFAELPQRQSAALVQRRIVRPVPLTISRLPAISSGPSLAGVIVTAPLRLASGVDSEVGGSPVAANPSAAWLPSQNGLLADRPQRHSVARNIASWPSIASSA